MEKQKLHYSIGQVAEYLDLPQSVLRYWETVFDRLNPEKSPGGNRLYSENDIKMISTIKNLLYTEGFTIKGANQKVNTLFPEDGSTISPSEKPPQSIDPGSDEVADNQSGGWSPERVIRKIQLILKILDE